MTRLRPMRLLVLLLAAVALSAVPSRGGPRAARASATPLAARLAAATSPRSVSSWPPDNTRYVRRVIPDDYLGAGGAGVGNFFLVDTVVSNTNAGLTNTDTFSDKEDSIAIDPNN